MLKGKGSLVLILVLALVLAVLVAAFFASVANLKPVVVAAHPLGAGTRLNEKAVVVKRIPAAAVLPDAFSSIEEVKGQVLTMPRNTGDQITASMVGPEAASTIAAALPSTHRAVAIHVDRATGLMGMIGVGDKVSVVAVLDPTRLNILTVSPIVEAGKKASSPPGPMAIITVSGLRVLKVPQLFRYQEIPQEEGETGSLWAPAVTTMAQQEEGVVLLDVPMEPVEVAPGLKVSPVELLPLLDATARIHLVWEPEDADYSIATVGVDLADLVEAAQEMQATGKGVARKPVEAKSPTGGRKK